MRPRELVAGNCYFHVNFSDLGMLFPMIQTLVYHSVAEDEDGVRRWLFQEPPSVSEAGGEIVPSPSAEFMGFSDQQLGQILDFPGLSRALIEVAADHPIHPSEPGRTADSKAAMLADLETEVGRFLGNPEYPYLAITVLFTGYGLSLTRFREGVLHAEFYLDCRKVPEHESKIRDWFAAKGITPSEDYLANKGRTRTLSFPVGSQPDELVAICREMILEVFGLEDDDAIAYAFGTSRGPA